MKTFKQFLHEGINDKGLFKAAFLGGQAGAGKSYVSKMVKDGKIDPRIVNTDNYLEFLADKRNLSLGPGFDKEKAEFAKLVKDSKRLTKSQLEIFVNGMLPLIIDSTSSNTSNVILRNKTLQFFGYDTAMVWINTSLDTAIKRAAARARQVPEKFIRKMFADIEENKKIF